LAQRYLEKFRSTVPSTQGNNILKILQKKRENGEFRTIDQLKNKLKELTTELLETKIKPTFSLWKAIGREDILSETFNDMISHAEYDFLTIFNEVDNLYTILDTHSTLIKDVALQQIERAINKLDAEVSMYEFLNNTYHGFDDGIYETFRDVSGSTTSRSDEIAKFVFTDKRTEKIVDASYNCRIDPKGERLLLGSSGGYVSIKSATHLAGADSLRSEIDASFKDSKISNIVDNQRQTYWAIPVLLSYTPSSGVSTEVSVDLYSSQDINFIEIDPASPYPLVLEGLSYINSSREEVFIDIDETILNRETVRVDFDKVTTSKLIFKFRQDNYEEVQFQLNGTTSLFEDAVVGNKYISQDIRTLDEFWKSFSSSFIVDDILSVSRKTKNDVRYYQYIIAIDNIRAGFNNYNQIGIYVSNKKQVSSLREIGLKVDEVRPTQLRNNLYATNTSFQYPVQSSSEDDKVYHGDVEYWVTVDFLDENDLSIKTHIVPILPLDATRIYHERLKFTKRVTSTSLLNDSGELRFYTNDDSSDVKVYRNGVELVYNTDWSFVANGNKSNLTNETAGNGTRMKRGIHISSRLNTLDNYTVSYSPVASSTIPAELSSTDLLKVVDLTGDLSLRVLSNNLIYVDSKKISSSYRKANIYLTIILNRNSYNTSLSPIVEEFFLAAGSENLEKFNG